MFLLVGPDSGRYPGVIFCLTQTQLDLVECVFLNSSPDHYGRREHLFSPHHVCLSAQFEHVLINPSNSWFQERIYTERDGDKNSEDLENLIASELVKTFSLYALF